MKNSLFSLFSSTKPTTLKNYPWKISLSQEIPSIWASFKMKHLEKAGEKLANSLLKEAYHFPMNFTKDSLKVVSKTLEVLSEDGANKSKLLETMADGIAQLYVDGFKKLEKEEKSVEFLFQPKDVKITGFHFTFGPLEIPNGYVQQEWFEFVTIILPEADSTFVSHPRQNELLEMAKLQGCHFRVDCLVRGDLEFVLYRKDLPLLRDKRDSFKVSFTSPHFTPHQEIFKLKNDGTWELLWNWKIIDIDDSLKK
jgi:hypothetical protein